MRSRAVTFIWIPFVFSIGTISWALLLAGLVLLAGVIVSPAVQEVKDAEVVRNDYQATLDLLDQKIALQNEFVEAATKEPVLMERLALRQLNLNRKDQELLILDPAVRDRDPSVESLIKESLTEVKPKPVPPMHPLLAMAANPSLRPMLIMVAGLAIALSFFVGVKYERV